MKYGKRIIAILLAAVLTMGTLPQAALAEEPTETTAACTEPVETTQIPETTAETAAPETTGPTEESVPETTTETAPAVTEESVPDPTGQTTAETTGETVPETTAETEPEALPYGLPGLPEDYILSDEELADKADMISHQVAQQTASLMEGTQYESGILLVWADTEETAQAYAQAFSAELVCRQDGLATLRLNGVSVVEALTAAQESDRLPAAYPNHIAVLPPDEGEWEENPGLALFSEDIPQTQTWRSWLDNTENPDPYLTDPTSDRYQYMHDTVDSYAAWGVTTGKGVTVAILDSGVMANHEDLPNVTRIEVFYKNASLGLDDAKGHGTHVAGIIGAAMGNGKGGAGIAPGVKLLSLRITNDAGSSTDAKLICGLQAAVKAGAQIVNISLGGPAYSAVFQKAINEATEAGVTVVAAMGNDGTNCLNYPAGYDNVIGVVSVDRTNNRASGSSYGTWGDVAAPGAVTWSTINDGSYWHKSGTSMASPVVAGVAALYKSVHPDATPAQITARLKATATKGGSDLGAGIVNAAAALSEKPGIPTAEIRSGETGEVLSRSDGGALSAPWDGQLCLTGTGRFLLYTLDGKTPGIREGQIVRGQRYNGPISLADYAGQTLTVKAMAVGDGGLAGSVLTCRIQVKKGTEIGSVAVSGPRELLAGKTGEFQANVTGVNPEAPVEQTVTWRISDRSDNMARAAIGASTGKLTTPRLSAGDEGWVEVTAVSKTGQVSSEPFRVTVKALNPVAKIALSTRKISCYTGNTATLTVTMLDSKGNPVSPEVLWSSSKPQVATVENGVVTALAKGSTTIICKALDGSGKTAKCTVTVAQAVESLTITGPASLAPGASFTFKAQAAPKGAVSRFTWSVLEGPEGTRITNGRLSVPKDAQTGDIITISAQPPEGGGAGAEYTLRVAPKCASVHTSIPWDSDSPYAPLSESYDRAGNLTGLTLYSVQPGEYSKRKDCVLLSADPMDARGRYLDNAGCLRWSSSNPSIVSVTDDGFVQAHKAGTAKITVSALDGSGKKQTVTVRVENPVSKIALSTSAPRGRMLITPLLAAGKSVSHKVTFAETYGRPTNQKITWSWTLKDSNGWDQTEAFARYIGLTSGGRLSIRSNAQSILSDYRDANITLKLTVIAQSQDFSGAYDTVTYLLVPPATKLYARKSVVSIEPGGTVMTDFYSNQFAQSKGSNFVFTSSNPKVASVIGDSSGSSAGEDGWFTLKIHSTQTGTAKITIRTTDGTNRSCTITVRSTPKKEQS
mgnify:CR=1 FL=1